MDTFKKIITLDKNSLSDMFDEFVVSTKKTYGIKAISNKLKLNNDQLICAIGFNPIARKQEEFISAIFNFEEYNELAQKRNKFFINDVYKKLTLDNVTSIYSVIRSDPQNKHIMEYLLPSRISNIEKCIEKTVNTLFIEQYKAEMNYIYTNNIANNNFLEKRLKDYGNGFRAMFNEILLIVENKVISANEIFCREDILPMEKKRLLDKRLIPINIVKKRLKNNNISDVEKTILCEYLKLNTNS